MLWVSYLHRSDFPSLKLFHIYTSCKSFREWWLHHFSGQSVGTQRRCTGCWQHWPEMGSSNKVLRSSQGQALSCHLRPPKGQQEVWKRKLKFPVKYFCLLLVLFVGGWWLQEEWWWDSTMRGLSLSSTRSQWFGQGYFQFPKQIFNKKTPKFNNIFFISQNRISNTFFHRKSYYKDLFLDQSFWHSVKRIGKKQH